MTEQVTITQALKPCPKCGKRAFMDLRNSVWCIQDRCIRMPAYETQAEAITAWNTRKARVCKIHGDSQNIIGMCCPGARPERPQIGHSFGCVTINCAGCGSDFYSTDCSQSNTPIETNSRTGDTVEGLGVAAAPPLSHPSGRAQEVSGKAGIANARDTYREIAETLRDELEATYVGADADLKGSLGESYIAFGAACARRAVKALTQCTCGEVAGEDPWCTQHGRGTDWAESSQERGI